MYVYLKPGVIQENNWIHGNTYKLFGLTVSEDDLRWHLILGESGRLPIELAGLVEGVSIIKTTPAYAHREVGKYLHKTATGFIDIQKGSPSDFYRIHVEAENPKDGFELIHLFKVGKIRPDESYEGPQGGRSRAELEAEVTQLRKDIMHLDTVINRTRVGLLQLLEELSKKRFPFSWDEEVIERLEQINLLLG